MKLLKTMALAVALSVFGASAIFAGSCTVDGKPGTLILNGTDRTKAVCRIKKTVVNAQGFRTAQNIFQDILCVELLTVNIHCDF